MSKSNVLTRETVTGFGWSGSGYHFVPQFQPKEPLIQHLMRSEFTATNSIIQVINPKKTVVLS